MKKEEKSINLFKENSARALHHFYTNGFSPNECKPTTTALEHTLINDWKELLLVDEISVHDNFFEMGGNFLLAYKVISKMNKMLGTHLPASTLFEHPTIKTLAKAFVDKKKPNAKSLLLLKEGNNKIPLYLVGYIGGSVDRFCEFAHLFHKEQPVYGLQTPMDIEDFNREGFNVEYVAVNYIKDTASRYVTEILEQNPDGPFALSGYSYGGFIALEMAKQLKAMGKKIALLALFDTIVPATKKTLPPKPEGTSLKSFSGLGYQGKLLNQIFRIRVYDNLFLLKNDRKQWLQNKIGAFRHFFSSETNALKEENIELKTLTKKRKEMAILAKKNYNLEFYDGEVALFRARKRSSYYVNNLMLGWGPYCRSIKVYRVDGDHVSMFNPFYCRRLATLLQQVLDGCNKNDVASINSSNQD